MPEPSESLPHAELPGPADAPGRPRQQSVTLRERLDLGRGCCLLRFSADEPIVARAGQFAMLRAEDWTSAPLLPRPMSLLTGGAEPSFLVKVVGEGTRRMVQAPLGTGFTMLAPLGAPWSQPRPDARAVLVAGGVGLPPLLFLARELAEPREAARGRQQPLLLYGGRSAEELPLAHEAEAVAELRIATDDGSRGTHGLVTALLEPALDDLGRSGRAAELFSCGPHAMMAAVAAIASRRGLRCQVSLETRMACGYGVCLGCATARVGGGYLYACNEGPCVDAAAVDWQAEAPR